MPQSGDAVDDKSHAVTWRSPGRSSRAAAWRCYRRQITA